MKWHIGQEIVAIKNHHQASFKKGDIFTIKGLESPFCKCNDIQINIGVLTDIEFYYCGRCYGRSKTKGVHWFSEEMFAPIDTQAITQLLEEVKASVA